MSSSDTFIEGSLTPSKKDMLCKSIHFSVFLLLITPLLHYLITLFERSFNFKQKCNVQFAMYFCPECSNCPHESSITVTSRGICTWHIFILLLNWAVDADMANTFGWIVILRHSANIQRFTSDMRTVARLLWSHGHLSPAFRVQKCHTVCKTGAFLFTI